MKTHVWNRAIARSFASICAFACLAIFTTRASAVDYYNAVITGIGIAPGENQIRFTIDKDPFLILTTTDYQGEQLQRLTAMILSAYTTQTPVYLVRSAETSSSTSYHYSDVIFFSLGARTWD